MATCFIFTKYLQEDGCFMLGFNNQNTLEIEPRHYLFEEIKSLQENHKTILVFPCEQASLFDLELPWLAERKARAAIPYALEDRLSQPIEMVHIAFDKQHYANNHYEIAVIEKAILQSLIALFEKQDIHFDSITLDWYALHRDECAQCDETLLIHSTNFKGAVSAELITLFKEDFNSCTTYTFADSKLAVDYAHMEKIDQPSCVWIAQRLLENKPLNVCQGELQHGNSASQIKRGYQYVAGLCVFWLFVLIGVNAFNLHFVNQELADVDQQIALLYKKFFPEAKQVISPKFRITQLMGNALTNDQSNFWNLLQKLATANVDNLITVEQVRFQNKTLTLSVASPDFDTLEKFEDKLQALQLKVTQTQAGNRDQQVIATLELT